MAKTAFHWDDPLLLDQQLSEDERMIREADATVESFRSAMLDEINQRSKVIPPIAPSAPSSSTASYMPVSLRYNPKSLDAFKRFGNKAEEMAYRSGMWTRAVLFGDRQAARWCADQGIQSRVMSMPNSRQRAWIVGKWLRMNSRDRWVMSR
jgi:hypothetical protein